MRTYFARSSRSRLSIVPIAVFIALLEAALIGLCLILEFAGFGVVFRFIGIRVFELVSELLVVVLLIHGVVLELVGFGVVLELVGFGIPGELISFEVVLELIDVEARFEHWTLTVFQVVLFGLGIVLDLDCFGIVPVGVAAGLVALAVTAGTACVLSATSCECERCL